MAHRQLKTLDEVLAGLLEDELVGVERSAEDTLLSVTQLGAAVSASFLTPAEGLFLYRELGKARAGLDLRSDLQLLYLVSGPVPAMA